MRHHRHNLQARRGRASLALRDTASHKVRKTPLFYTSRQHYAASGNAPRAVYLTLWFESRWDMDTLHAQALNEAQHARVWVASLERECEGLHGVIRAYANAQRRSSRIPLTLERQ